MRSRIPVSAVLAVLLVGLSAVTARGQGVAIDVRDGRYDPALLTAQDPVLAEIFQTARDVGFRVGTWGGASRDYLLGRGSPPEFSDVDMVYDSRELWKALTSEGPVGFVKKTARLVKGFYRVARVGGLKALRRYTYLDAKEGGRSLTTSVVKMINSGAGTVNQVGLMSDGTVFDPTGGLADVTARQLRYRTPKPVAIMAADLNDIHNPSPYDVLRMIRFKVQYPELEWAPGTYERLRDIMRLYAPGSEYTREVAAYQEGLKGAFNRRLPGFLKHPVSALRSNLGDPDRADLWPFVEKGLKKVLASTPDPAESLRLVRDLGVDAFAEEVGLGKYVRELEEKAAAAPAPVPPTAAAPPPEATTPPLPTRPVPGDTGPVLLTGTAAEDSPPEVIRGSVSPPASAVHPADPRGTALRAVGDQAYENFLDAQRRGDQAAAGAHYRIYLEARAAGGAR